MTRPAAAASAMGETEYSSAEARIARALVGDVSPAVWDAADLRDVVECARGHGIDLVLWHLLHDDPGAPPALIRELELPVAAEVARAAIRERELARVLRSLDAHGVGAVVIKGAALAHAWYPRPWLRPRLDTDVLVDRASFERAGAALNAAGYRRSGSFSTGDFVSHQVAFERTDGFGVEHIIDLHWKPLNPQMLSDLATMEDLQAGGRDIGVARTTIRIPDAVWSLLLACAHRLAHHQRQPRLIWAYDIHLLARSLDAAGWQLLLDRARERGVSALCADGLAAADRLAGGCVPHAVVQQLDAQGRGEASRRYVERPVRRFDVLRDDLRRLPRWRDRARLLREHALPSVSFMETRYGTRNRLLLPVLYARRLVTGAYRWMRT